MCKTYVISVIGRALLSFLCWQKLFLLGLVKLVNSYVAPTLHIKGVFDTDTCSCIQIFHFLKSLPVSTCQFHFQSLCLC
jgi:hypothetical protein